MRHAIYYAPAPGSAFHALGSAWLGRDAFTGETLQQPDIAGIGVVTGDPRRYGFHATLKPPFALREAVGAEALLRATAALAGSEENLAITLKVAVLDQFLALVPGEPSHQLQQLADRAVRALDGFRQPPPADELYRRRRNGLTPSQEQHLVDWGYPYVLEDFRFHMTLTERLPPAYIERYRAAAEVHFAHVLKQPVVIDGFTHFAEATPGAAFVATRQFPFSLPAAEVAA